MCVIPSLEDNLPNIMLESMACGTPAIAFDVGGIGDIIKEGETGLLATRPRGTESLADKIIWMVSHLEERLKMGRQARKLIERNYTAGLQAERYLKLYMAILKDKN